MTLELHYNDDYFRFTRGRFVFNEGFELSQRYVHFNVQELARIAAEAVGSASCGSMEKHPDGLYNKALLLTMEACYDHYQSGINWVCKRCRFLKVARGSKYYSALG